MGLRVPHLLPGWAKPGLTSGAAGSCHMPRMFPGWGRAGHESPAPSARCFVQAGLRAAPCCGRSCSQPGEPCADMGATSPISITHLGGSSLLLWLLWSPRWVWDPAPTSLLWALLIGEAHVHMFQPRDVLLLCSFSSLSPPLVFMPLTLCFWEL